MDPAAIEALVARLNEAARFRTHIENDDAASLAASSFWRARNW
ncbi:hypothetical protein [Paraburkholderia sp. BCC1876]|nr:hypothetical protein [Paraburkholderia sp. BCC1876]